MVADLSLKYGNEWQQLAHASSIPTQAIQGRQSTEVEIRGEFFGTRTEGEKIF